MVKPKSDVFEDLLAQARIRPVEVAGWVARARDRAYWQALVPQLTIEDNGDTAGRSDQPDPAVAAAAADAARDGVFKLADAVDATGVAAANAAIDAVISDRWPPLFAFVYDEPWRTARTPRVMDVVARTLGPGAAQIPHIWTHIVRPAVDASGWPPHVDSFAPDGRLTVWIALTDASIENGCMYVVPRAAAPANVVERFATDASFTSDEAIAMLHAATPLPAAAGDALGWAFDVVHWGGRAQPGARERRSMSLEFVSAAAAPQEDERPLLPLDRLPPFEERLRTIGRCLVAYRYREPLVTRFLDVARALARESDSIND